MNHPLRCRCGTLKGHVSHPERATRIICYCKDCQSFARFLGKPDEILDGMGGTEVVATTTGNVVFTQGTEHLACMSLTDNGLLRWYASCCRTPIGSVFRNHTMPHVAIVHSCLEGSPESLNESFGPIRLQANTGSANGKPEALRHSFTFAVLRILWFMLRARLDGSYKRTPFFDLRGVPVVPPSTISSSKRDQGAGGG